MRDPRATKLKQFVQQAASLLFQTLLIPAPLAGVTKEESFQDSTTMLWTNVNSPIYPWLHHMGVSHKPGVVPPFADGGAGRAYFLGDKVVKFSRNKVEANVAKMVAGRNDLPTNVIAVTPIASGLYAILQHYVDTGAVSKQIRSAADYLTLVIDNNPDIVEQGFPSDPAAQQKLAQDAVQKFGRGDEAVPYMMIMMEMLNQLFHATGFLHTDATPTNLGKWQGRVRIPDLGPNKTDADPLAKINQNRERLGLPAHEPI